MDQVLCRMCAPSGAMHYLRDIRQFLWSHRSETQTDLVIISGDTSFNVHQAVILPLSDHLTELLPPYCPCTKPAICLPPFPSHVLTAAVEILYTGTTAIAASQEDQIKVKEVLALLKIKADVDRDMNIEATKKKIFQKVEEDLEAMFAGLEDSDTEKRTKKASSESTSDEPTEKKGELSAGTVSEGVIREMEPNYPLAIPENEQKITPYQDIYSCYLNEVTGVFCHDERENVSGMDDAKSCKNNEEEEPSVSFEFIQSQGPMAVALILNEVTGVFYNDERQNISGLDQFQNSKMNDNENVDIVTGNYEVAPRDEKIVKFDNNENESLKKHEITKCPKQAKRKNLKTFYTFGSEEEHPSTSSQTAKLRARKRKDKEPDEVRKGIRGLGGNLLSSVSKQLPGNKKLRVTGLDGSILSTVMKPQFRNKKQKRSATTQSSPKFACSKCDYTSERKENLKRHNDAMHEHTSYSCDKCAYVSKWKGNVKKHIKFVHEEIYYDCDKCDFTTAYKQTLKNHIAAFHLEISHKCDQCDFTTKWKNTLKKHILSAHQNIYLNCDQCEFRTMWKISLKKHTEAHKNNYFKCDQCDYETAWLGNFKRHIEGVHETIAYNCNQCNFTTTWKEYLQRHIKGTHAGAPGYPSNRKAVDKPTVTKEVAANCRTRSQKMSPDVAAAVNFIPRASENGGPSFNRTEQKRFQKKSKAKGDNIFSMETKKDDEKNSGVME